MDVPDLLRMHKLRALAETDFRATERTLIDCLLQKVSLSDVERAYGKELVEATEGPRGLRPLRMGATAVSHWRLRRGSSHIEWRESVIAPAEGESLATYHLEFGAFGLDGAEPLTTENSIVMETYHGRASLTRAESDRVWRLRFSDTHPSSTRALSLASLSFHLARESQAPRQANGLEGALIEMREAKTSACLLTTGQVRLAARLTVDMFAHRSHA